MAVLDTAIHAFLFKNWRPHESSPRLLGVIPIVMGFDP
jgi:hypothetical protein